MKKELHPLVSIVIPVYNGEKYMREAIDSALAQTYDNIEIIVVNDGSMDSTDEIAKSYGEKIRYFAKENGGVSTALNIGINNMRGEYFSWLSHDDLYTPDKIEKNIAALQDNPTQIVYSDYCSVNEKGEYIGTVSGEKLHRAADYGYGLFPIISGLIHGCSLLIHRSQFEKYGLFDEKLRTTQDYDLWFKMFRGQRLIYIPEALVKGRVHPKQATHSSDKTIPEGEALWTSMFQSLTHEELRAIGGSVRHFWINQAPFMKYNTQYIKSTEYAFERLKTSVDELRGGLVSVITPFYNRIDMVIECIKCVQNQTYQNWELLLINDGSTDDVREIERCIASDERIKLIHSEHNMGVANARNIGLNAITGKFIAFLDSDDKWRPQKLEKQIKFMLDNNYCASHTNYRRVDIDGNLLESINLSWINGDVFTLYLHSCSIATPCVIVEREFWGDLRFPQSVDYGEDICVWLELAWRGKWGGLLEELTYVYVNKASSSQDKRKQQLGYTEIMRYILKNDKWANYQTEIGIMARDFANLFPKPALLPLPIPRYNIPLRLINAIKRHGATGVWKIFWQRLKLKLKG